MLFRSERGEIKIQSYDGTDWTTVRRYYPGVAADAQTQREINIFFTFTAAEVLNKKFRINFETQTGSGFYFKPRFYDCGNFSHSRTYDIL